MITCKSRFYIQVPQHLTTDEQQNAIEQALITWKRDRILRNMIIWVAIAQRNNLGYSITYGNIMLPVTKIYCQVIYAAFIISSFNYTFNILF
ncbi:MULTISPECIES: hypothetical protein [Nostocales]|uniref:hypothetical protein n=1 Tax=Nostocales TaxID=1161 RepID=UPI001F549695|nr:MULTISPECIES: hypothetical protein [Nostocales]